MCKYIEQIESVPEYLSPQQPRLETRFLAWIDFKGFTRINAEVSVTMNRYYHIIDDAYQRAVTSSRSKEIPFAFQRLFLRCLVGNVSFVNRHVCMYACNRATVYELREMKYV